MIPDTPKNVKEFVKNMLGPASQQDICDAIDEYLGAENPVVLARNDQARYELPPFDIEVFDGYMLVTEFIPETNHMKTKRTKPIYQHTCQEQIDNFMDLLVAVST
jgi:predicted choloylglycine hydrolase